MTESTTFASSRGWIFRPSASLVLAALCGSVFFVSPAAAIDVSCGTEAGADGFGWAVAGGQDFDGDGVPDVAVGAPCATIGSQVRVGRVRVFSGATGRRLYSLRGVPTSVEIGQQFGSAIALIPDIDGDGRAELVVGSSRFNGTNPSGGTINNAGKVEVFSSKGNGKVLWTQVGTGGTTRLGETVSWIPDVSGDGRPEVIAGGSGGRVNNERHGIAYLFSGANGAEIARNEGVYQGESWASIVAGLGDVDGDGVADWVATSNIARYPIEGAASQRFGVSGWPSRLAKAMGSVFGVAEPAGGGFANQGASSTTTTTESSTSTSVVVTSTMLPSTTMTTIPVRGRLAVISGSPPYEEIVGLLGAKDDRLGRSVAPIADIDGDGMADFVVGSMGATVAGALNAGKVTIFNGFGETIREFTEPLPRVGSNFGMSVAVPGPINGGTKEDIVVAAPNAADSGFAQAGRLYAFDSTTGALLWTKSGTGLQAKMGQSLEAAGWDANGDGVGDVLVGVPGESPNGRRGAGTALLISSKTGATIGRFDGVRGRETRVYVAGPGMNREPTVRSYDALGRRREPEIRPFRGQRATDLSLGLLDQGGRESANTVLLAIGTGRAGSRPDVVVYRAGRRRVPVSGFAAGPDGYSGGVNVATGDFASQAGDEIAAVPADDVAGPIHVVVHRRQFTDPLGNITWTRVRDFPVFSAGEQVEGQEIDADGVHIVGGNVAAADRDELVVAPIRGLPVVRVYSNTGARISEWLAYPKQGPGITVNSGTSIALGDIDGNGSLEILTAPASGQLWVRAWRSNGTPFEIGGTEVSFFVTQFGPTFTGGLGLGAADVDLDGSAEILVSPGPGAPAQILAFKPDGTLVPGWKAYRPYGPLADKGLTLLGTDRFWRR